MTAKFEKLKENLFRYLPTGEIYFRKTFKHLGIPGLRKNTGEKSLGAAKARAAQMEREWVNFHKGVISNTSLISARKGTTFRDVAEKVLETYTPTLRARTQYWHTHDIPKLIAVFGDRSVNSISDELFQSWVKDQRRKVKRKTFANFMKLMNVVMTHAYEWKACSHLIQMSNPDQKGQTFWRVYTQEEITELYTVMGQRLRLQFLFSYECFMRLNEVLKLRWDQLDLKTGEIILGKDDVKTGSKTGRGRAFIVSQRTLASVRTWYMERDGDSPYVFPAFKNPRKPQSTNQKGWRIAKRNAEMFDKATWHSLRHTAITNALMIAKLPTREVSLYAGVSERVLNEVYLHPKAEHLRDVSNALSVFGVGNQWETDSVMGKKVVKTRGNINVSKKR